VFSTWPEVNVLDLGSELMVLCKPHTRVRSFGQWLTDTGFGGSAGGDIAMRLAALWSTPCPVEESSESEGDRDAVVPPTTSGGGDVAVPVPVSQGGL
jgi:hypothetical protein